MKELRKIWYILQLQSGHFSAISFTFKSVINTVMKIITNDEDGTHYSQKRQNTPSEKYIESKMTAWT